MTKRMRTATAGAAIFVGALGTILLAGCGGDDSSTPRVEKDGYLYDVAGVAGECGGGHDNDRATHSRLYWPQDMTRSTAGELLLADWNNHVIRSIRPNGTIYRIMGSGIHGDDSNGPALQVNLNHPDGIALGPDGNIYIASWHNWKIKECNMSTMYISSAVGNDNGFSGDGGPATAAAISLPSSVVWDPLGNMYLSDQGNNRIRKVDTEGIITTFAGASKGYAEGIGAAAHFAFPNGTDAYPGGRIDISHDGTSLFVADTENNRIRKIDIATGTVTLYAGRGIPGYEGDGGSAINGCFNYPTDVACTADGSLFIADAKNNAVRKISPTGTLTTIAGTGVEGVSPDGTLAVEAELDWPSALYWNEETATLYISDTYNCQVKKIINP